MTEFWASGDAAVAGTDAALHLAWAYLDANTYLRAEEVLRSALTDDPGDPRLLTTLARSKLGQEEFVDAENAARAALASAPRDEWAMHACARALQGQDRIAEALEITRNSVTHHPHSSAAHHWHAELLRAAGRPEEALIFAEEAMRLDPHDVETMVLRADVLLANRRIGLDHAVDGYRDALTETDLSQMCHERNRYDQCDDCKIVQGGSHPSATVFSRNERD